LDPRTWAALTMLPMKLPFITVLAKDPQLPNCYKKGKEDEP